MGVSVEGSAGATTVDSTTAVTRLPRDKSVCVAMMIAASAAASFTAIPEVSYDDEASYATLTLTKSDGTTTAALTVVGSAAGGWARVPGATHARFRLSAITTPSTGVTGRVNVTDGI